MKLGNAICHEHRVLNDETLGKVLVELPRLLNDRGIKDGSLSPTAMTSFPSRGRTSTST